MADYSAQYHYEGVLGRSGEWIVYSVSHIHKLCACGRCHREYGIPGDLASSSKFPTDFAIPTGNLAPLTF